MSMQAPGLFSRLTHQRSTRHWARLARAAGRLDLDVLRWHRAGARRLRAHLDQLIHVADERLHLPRPGSMAMRVPHDADWCWRPELWRGRLPVPGIAAAPSGAMLGPGVCLFHDCAVSELVLRQMRNTRAEDLASHGLRLDVFHFDGSYLSLVVDLPPEAARGLTRHHLLCVETLLEVETPLDIFARLNIQCGPNTEQLVRAFPASRGEIGVAFDLAYAKLNERRVDKLWLDLIFDAPDMNHVVLLDLTFSRRPRAEF